MKSKNLICLSSLLHQALREIRIVENGGPHAQLNVHMFAKIINKIQTKLDFPGNVATSAAETKFSRILDKRE